MNLTRLQTNTPWCIVHNDTMYRLQKIASIKLHGSDDQLNSYLINDRFLKQFDDNSYEWLYSRMLLPMFTTHLEPHDFKTVVTYLAYVTPEDWTFHQLRSSDPAA